MGSPSIALLAVAALATLSSVGAQDPRSLNNAASTAAPGLFGFTFPTFAPLNIPTLAPIGIPCLGASSQSSGTCRKDADECSANGGALDGNCLAGLGQCCVQPLKCGAIALTNGSFLANSNFPKPTTDNTQCTLTITKLGNNIKQIRLELIKFQVGAPDAQGKCVDDFMMIQSGLSPGASIPRLCGINDGQHIILPVEQSKDLTVVIRFSISGRSKSTWMIQAIQQNSLNPMLAPDNCLQYHTGPTGDMMSLSAGANLDSLRYSICFRRETDYCSIKFTLQPRTGAVGTTDNTSSNSTTTESRKRREAHGNYQPGQYVQPAPQRQSQYVRPVQYLVPQRPVVRPVHYKYPVYPLVKPAGYRPPYDSPFPEGWYPSHSTRSPIMNGTTMSNIMPLEPMMSTTPSNNETANATDSVTDRNVPIEPVTPVAPNCDGQDIVLFPPSTIVCENVNTTPVVLPQNINIVFVDNRGQPTHSPGWAYRFDYQSCQVRAVRT